MNNQDRITIKSIVIFRTEKSYLISINFDFISVLLSLIVI